MNTLIKMVLFLTMATCLFAQKDGQGSVDRSDVSVGRVRSVMEIPGGVEGALTGGTLHHPYHIEARHPDGTLFYSYDGFNLRTTAGTNWMAELMGKVTTPTVNAQCNYLALTNTAITPAEADTTLSGEISSNGLDRASAQAVFTNVSTTLAVPGAPTIVVTGGAGGTAQFYFVEACNQGICTTPGTVSTTATANATLDTTHYFTGTFTGQNGAATYVVIRSNSSSTPSGSLAGGSTQSSTGQVGSANVSCTSALSCTFVDNSNTLAAYTVPGSNVTNFGKYTLVHTWTATAAQSAQAFGVFTASSVGTMCFEGTFTQVSLNTNDTFQLTESVFF